MTVEADLKTQITNASWAGLTQAAYNYTLDKTKANPLDNPPVSSGNITVVIFKADDSTRQEYYNSDFKLFSGLIKMWGANGANLDTAKERLKDVGDVLSPKGALTFFTAGTEQLKLTGKYFSLTQYEWKKFVTRT